MDCVCISSVWSQFNSTILSLGGVWVLYCFGKMMLPYTVCDKELECDCDICKARREQLKKRGRPKGSKNKKV